MNRPPRRRKSARERREQRLRAEARASQRLVRGLADLHAHRGSQLTTIGAALLVALNSVMNVGSPQSASAFPSSEPPRGTQPPAQRPSPAPTVRVEGPEGDDDLREKPMTVDQTQPDPDLPHQPQPEPDLRQVQQPEPLDETMGPSSQPVGPGAAKRQKVSDEAQPDEVLPDEVLPDEARPMEAQPDEAQPDEVLPDEVLPDEAQPMEAQPDGQLPDEDATIEDAAREDAAEHDEPHPQPVAERPELPLDELRNIGFEDLPPHTQLQVMEDLRYYRTATRSELHSAIRASTLTAARCTEGQGLDRAYFLVCAKLAARLYRDRAPDT